MSPARPASALPALVILLLATASPLPAASAPGRAGTPPGGRARAAGPSLLLLELAAGPLLGLEAPLRGASANAGLRAAWEGFAPGLRLGLRWDGALAAPIGEALLLLALGPELAFFAGMDLPLGALRPFAGMEDELRPADFPSRLGFAASLLRLAEPGPGGPGLELEAELAFSRLRPGGAAATGTEAAATAGMEESALASFLVGPGGFSLGLTAALRLRLGIGLGRGRAR